MADHDPDTRLDSRREAAVRRRLAEARHDGPVPDDVAARLDRVLAELVAEGPPAPGPERGAPVVDLAAVRRRRVRRLLVAAAAVGVIGVGLGQVGLPSLQSGSDGDTAGVASDAGGDAGGASEGDADELTPFATGSDEAEAEDYAASAPAPEAPAVRDAPTALTSTPLAVGDADFATESRLRALRRLTSEARPAAGAEDSSRSDSPDPLRLGAAWFLCKPGPYGAGRLIAVEYDGRPAVLALRPSTGDSSVVELLRCGTADVLRSATVPVP